MSKVFNSAESLIGNTPLVKLNNLKKELGFCADIYAKPEFLNLTSSVKDRAALEMINDAESKGILKKNSVIIEPTSGNTGIGLCAIGAARGYKVIIVMPETMSAERKMLVKAFGATLIETDGAAGMSGAIKKAEEIAKDTKNSFIAGQFSNPANAAAHYKTTGPEIYSALQGKVDIFVCGVGSGGTVTGVGKYLKEQNKNIQIVAVEPKGSAVLSGEKAGAHGLQGIGAGFIPSVLDTSVFDRIITVTESDAYAASRSLAKSEGMLVGISSGAALFAATLVGKESENKDKNIVVLLPDTGERYLSTPLFRI